MKIERALRSFENGGEERKRRKNQNSFGAA